MSGITNPAEEYFKDGLWGWVSTAWKKLVATAGGALHVQFAGQEADVEVTQTAAADLTPGICGWDGAAWRKLPLLFGYSDRWVEEAVGTATGTGDAITATAFVDPGYIYGVQVINCSHDAGVPKQMEVYLQGAGVTVVAVYEATWTSGAWKLVMGSFVMKEGDRIYAHALAPGNGKKVYLRCWGFKMKIAE